MSINALALVTGRHPNTVREHLGWLLDVGLVVRHRAEQGRRGRPAWIYEAVGPHPSEDDHAELAAALAWSLGAREEEDPGARATAAGRRWGRELSRDRGARVQETAQGAREQVLVLLDDLGFAPRTDDGARNARLTRCPLLQAAHVNQGVVCAMHLGLVEGALEVYGAPTAGVDLAPFAEPGACLLTLDGAATS